MKKLFIILLLSCSCTSVFSQTKITAQEASKYIGDSVLIFDKVYGGKLLKNGVTLLSVGHGFPDQLLVVRINADDRAKFKFKPEEQFKGKQVVISGKLGEVDGKPEIRITTPEQITETNIADPRLYLKKQDQL